MKSALSTINLRESRTPCHSRSSLCHSREGGNPALNPRNLRPNPRNLRETNLRETKATP